MGIFNVSVLDYIRFTYIFSSNLSNIRDKFSKVWAALVTLGQQALAYKGRHGEEMQNSPKLTMGDDSG